MPATPSLAPPPSRDAATPGSAMRALLAYGHFVFHYRNALMPIMVLSLVVFTRPRPFAGDPRRDVILDVLGLVVLACGQALRVLVIGLAYIQRGGKNKRIAADRLVIDGLFAHCRHPLYLGNFLLIAGLMMIWNAPAGYLFGLGGVGVSLYAMARAEEDFLQRKFGADYVAYCQRVNRFLPRLRGLGATIARFDFDWKRVVRKEYGTTFSCGTIAIVLIVMEHVEWEGVRAAGATITTAAIVWLCLAGLWGVARWAKKSRRLKSPD
jgi:protein-S-isoprenylcysteine O-methyltransferase Ste14